MAHAMRDMPPSSDTIRGSDVLTMFESITASPITSMSPARTMRRSGAGESAAASSAVVAVNALSFASHFSLPFVVAR